VRDEQRMRILPELQAMSGSASAENLKHTIDFWFHELDQYNFDQLCAQPDPASWSIGQVYMHLVNETAFYLGQARVCLSTNDHATDEANANAQVMFGNNSFPDEVIEGPPSNANTPQPESKDQLKNGLLRLKNEAVQVGALIFSSTFRGKTKHPGLHYFSAAEWLQFADMHLRHHLRQKKRIDFFLGRPMGEF
jgi:hypothetical protein